MKHEIRKVSKIIDELTTYFLLLGIKEIKTSIKNKEDHFKIRFKLYDFNFKHPKIELLKELLNYPRENEMEEYYWELAGESDVDSELCLIGIMTDTVEIVEDKNELKITLIRYK